MIKEGIENTLCDECGQPLFLNKEECQAFIEGKLKQGYIVCSCCGMTRTAKE